MGSDIELCGTYCARRRGSYTPSAAGRVGLRGWVEVGWGADCLLDTLGAGDSTCRLLEAPHLTWSCPGRRVRSGRRRRPGGWP